MIRFKSLLLCSCLMFAQYVCAVGVSKAEPQINTQVKALSDAMVNADGAKLKMLTSPGLIYGHSSGRVENQAEFVANILNGNSNFLSINLEEQTIKVVGDIAIVRHILSGKSHDKGKDPGTVRIGVMLVWQKQKSDWLLVARQAYKLS